MQLRLLNADDVRQALPMPAAIAAMRVAFAEVAAGTAHIPLRVPVHTPAGVTLFMPAYLAESGGLAQKIVSVFAGNPARRLPVINGLIVVLDPDTGLPTGLLEGGTLTSIRTAAAAGLATDLLALPASNVMAGAHLNLSGAYTPAMQEAPPATVARARVYVDQPEAALAEAGDLLKPLAAGLISRAHFQHTLGDLVLGRVVVQGYIQGARRLGASLFTETGVTRILVEGDRERMAKRNVI